MIAVGIREIKNRLSEYLRRVRNGEVVLVTDRGTVVAQITRPGIDAVEADNFIARLETEGLISSRGNENEPGIYGGMSPVLPEGSVVALLDDERSER